MRLDAFEQMLDAFGCVWVRFGCVWVRLGKCSNILSTFSHLIGLTIVRNQFPAWGKLVSGSWQLMRPMDLL